MGYAPLEAIAIAINIDLTNKGVKVPIPYGLIVLCWGLSWKNAQEWGDTPVPPLGETPLLRTGSPKPHFSQNPNHKK